MGTPSFSGRGGGGGGGGQNRVSLKGVPFDSHEYVVRFRPIQPVGGAVHSQPVQPVGRGGGGGVLSTFNRFNQ